jgi:hypothetical protein
VEQQLPAGLGEGQIAELVRCGRGDPAAPLKEDHEVEAAEMVGKAALAAGAGLAVEPVDQVDNVVEAAAGAAPDAGPRDPDRQMGLARARTADQDQVALLAEEGAAGEITHQGLVDGRVGEGELLDLLGKRQLGDRELVPHRAGLLLAQLGREQVADDPLRLVLALHGRGDDLVPRVGLRPPEDRLRPPSCRTA